MVNLRQLLATSRSLIGVRRPPAPLKMVEQDFLPRFGTLAARLGGTATATQPKPEMPAPFPETEPSRQDMENELHLEARSAPAAEPPQAVPAESTPPPPQVTMPAPESPTGAGKSEARFTFFSRRQTKPGREEPPRREMSLGHVKVMRNDLRDADLELVEKRRGEATEQIGAGWRRLAAALVPDERMTAAHGAGRTLGAHGQPVLFGAGRRET